MRAQDGRAARLGTVSMSVSMSCQYVVSVRVSMSCQYVGVSMSCQYVCLCCQRCERQHPHMLCQTPASRAFPRRQAPSAKLRFPFSSFSIFTFSHFCILLDALSDARQPSIFTPPSAKRQAPISILFIFNLPLCPLHAPPVC